MLRSFPVWFSTVSLLGAQQAEEPPAAPVVFTAFPVVDRQAPDLAAATAAAIGRLLALQEGEQGDQWPYEGVYRERDEGRRGVLPVGYRVGGTSIVCLALLSAPGYGEDGPRHAALDRGLAFVLSTLDHPRMGADFVGAYDVRDWGRIYALQLLLELADRDLVPDQHAEAAAAKTAWLVEALCASAIPGAGGWNYSRPRGYLDPRNRASTFMTAPALQALFHAAARGHAVPAEVLDQGLAALERARNAAGGYAYGAHLESQNEVGDDALSMMDRVPGSAARSAVVETTLLLAGRGDAARHRRSVLRFFEHWDELAVRKSRTGTHVEPYGVAPYYFLFGHVYAAQAVEMLPDGEEKDALRAKMRTVLLRSRDADGSWNDRHFPRSAGYGTAMALLTLHMPARPRPVARPGGAAPGDR